MTIELKIEARSRLVGSIQKYFQLNMDEEIGELKAILLLDFFLKEMGPVVYNQAVGDCQGVMQERVIELDSVCFEGEGEFWKGK